MTGEASGPDPDRMLADLKQWAAGVDANRGKANWPRHNCRSGVGRRGLSGNLFARLSHWIRMQAIAGFNSGDTPCRTVSFCCGCTRDEAHRTRLDVLFKGVDRIDLPALFDGLYVKREGRTFVAHGPGWSGSISGLVMFAAEDECEFHEPSQLFIDGVR